MSIRCLTLVLPSVSEVQVACRAPSNGGEKYAACNGKHQCAEASLKETRWRGKFQPALSWYCAIIVRQPRMRCTETDLIGSNAQVQAQGLARQDKVAKAQPGRACQLIRAVHMQTVAELWEHTV